jgi:hypothetical protein
LAVHRDTVTSTDLSGGIVTRLAGICRESYNVSTCTVDLVWICDHLRGHNTVLDMSLMDNPLFDLRRWYAGIIYKGDENDCNPEWNADSDQSSHEDPTAGPGNSDNAKYNPTDSEDSMSAMDIDGVSSESQVDDDSDLSELQSVSDLEASEDSDALPSLVSISDTESESGAWITEGDSAEAKDDATAESSDGTASIHGQQRAQVHAPGSSSAHKLRSAAVHAFSVESPGGTSRIMG